MSVSLSGSRGTFFGGFGPRALPFLSAVAMVCTLPVALPVQAQSVATVKVGNETGGRCLVPVVKFAEPDKNTGMKTHGTPLVNRWFARPDGSLFAFAGIWRTWTGDRGTKTKPDVGQHTLYSFLTTDPADVARTAVFLAENASITGITITVDKGQHLVPLERDIMFVAEQLAVEQRVAEGRGVEGDE